MKLYKFYSDPSHGWLAVKKQELIDLDILNKISEYSYVKGKTVYLEEDRDASIFINAFRSKFNQEPMLIAKISDKMSQIRSYERVSSETIK